jgi:hypothetical protein
MRTFENPWAHVVGSAAAVLLAACNASGSASTPTEARAEALAGAIPVPSGTITTCFNDQNGNLRLLGPSDSCRQHESLLTWNQTGAQGPAGTPGATGPAGPPGTVLPTTIFFNRNFQDVQLAPPPGVTVARLNLPAGNYVITAKLRYRGDPDAPGIQPASCVFQGDGIGSLDSSQQLVPPGGDPAGTVDGVLYDIVFKQPTDAANVHVQCFGPPSVHIINTQFSAVAANVQLQQ